MAQNNIVNMQGRPISAQKAIGLRSNNGSRVAALYNRVPFADDADYAELAEQLSTPEAKAVLESIRKIENECKILPGFGRFFTKWDLIELRHLCEEEGNWIVAQREMVRLKKAGLPIPHNINKRDPDDPTIVYSSIGVVGELKRACDESRMSRNSLGLNKAARAKIMEDLRQADIFESEEPDIEAATMPPAEAYQAMLG